MAKRFANAGDRKIGAAVVVARRAGQNFTLAQLNYFFQINEMVLASSSYWRAKTAAPGFPWIPCTISSLM